MISDETRRAGADWWERRKESGWLYGFIGRPLGGGAYEYDVPGWPGMIWVRLANAENNETTLDKAVNFGALPNPRMLVRLERVNGMLVVEKPVPSSAVTLYGQHAPSASVPPTLHHIGSGNEDLVEDRRLLPGLVYASESEDLTVVIHAFDYPGGHWATAAVDLSAHVPATAERQRWVLVGVDAATNTPFAISGPDELLTGTLDEAAVYAIAHTETQMPKAAVALQTGQTAITPATRIIDLRAWGAAVYGSLEARQVANGRLTVAADEPVPAQDAGGEVLYLLPYEGNRVGLFTENGGWRVHAFDALSQAVPDTTLTNYDVFLFDDNGTLTLELQAWSNDTTRAVALMRQDGVYVQDGAVEKRYLGTVRTGDTTGYIPDNPSERFVWNAYNRRSRSLKVTDATSHSYNSATWRAWNDDSSLRFQFVQGLDEEQMLVEVVAAITAAAVGDAGGAAAGLNTDSDFSVPGVVNGNTGLIQAGSRGWVAPAAGYNYVQAVESGDAGNAPTFDLIELSAALQG